MSPSPYNLFSFTLLLVHFTIWPRALGANGVLRTISKDFCLTYNPNFSGLPEDEFTRKLQLVNSEPAHACSNITNTLKQRVAFVDRGECDFYVKALNADRAGAYGLIVANTDPEGSFMPGVTNVSQYKEVDIPVGMVSKSDAAEIRSMMQANGGHVDISLFAYPRSPKRFDTSNYLLALLAAVIVTLGCLWANPPPRRGGAVRRREGAGGLYESAYDGELFDWKMAVGLFVFMSVVLVALFFLYKYLVYIVMAMFVLGGGSAVAQVIHDLTLCIPSGKPVYIKLIGENITAKMVVEVAIGYAIGITWVVCRHEDWAWILQDTLGGCLIAVLLLSMRVPSLKIACLVLALFWVYDVFMTFITPLFMPHGESIMVSVAVGQREEMPMVLKLPHLDQPWYETLCQYRSYTMLGFGDLVIPGTFLCYLLRADRAYHPRIPSYFIVGIFSYLVGLAVTYVALFFMNKPQPALLYINPIIAAFALAQTVARKETAALWHGDFARVYAHAQMSQSDVMLALSDPESIGSDEGE